MPLCHEALGAGHAARIGDGGVRQLVVHPHVELRLAGAPVRKPVAEASGGRVKRIECSAHGLARLPRVVDHRDPAGRPRKGVGREVAGADAVRQPVARRPRHRRVRAEHRAGAESGARRPAFAVRCTRPLRVTVVPTDSRGGLG